MGLQANIDAVRKDIGTHAQNLFIEFFAKHPENLVHFPAYQGKSAAELKGMPKFCDHTKKVVESLLGIMERSGDAAQLKKDAADLVASPQHKALAIIHFQGLFDVLIPFLQNALGGACAAGDWKKGGDALLAEMKNAGMKAA